MLALVANQNQKGSVIQQDWIDDAQFARTEDDGLVSAAMGGDLSAFNRLVTAHQDGLFHWVYSLVSDEDLADDITQGTFITAYEKLGTFRGGSFKAWLFTIARNRSIDELRRRKRHPSFSLDDSDDDDRDLLSILPAQSPHPEDVLVKTELAEKVKRMLVRLPKSSQQVLVLVDMEEMDYHEAAEVLRVPIGTVKSRLARARLKLRQLLVETPD